MAGRPRPGPACEPIRLVLGAEAPERPLRVTIVDTSDHDRGSMRRYAVLVSSALLEAAPGRVTARNVSVGLPRSLSAKVPSRLRTAVHHGWVLISVVVRRRQLAADVVHLADGSHAYLLRLLPRPRVVTVHDIIPLLQIRGILGGRPPSRMARRLIAAALRSLRSADRILAVSVATAEDVKRHVSLDERRVQVLPLAPVAAFTDSPRWALPPADGVRLILHVGSDAFYKNREGVIRIFARLRPSRRLRLVMVGPRPDGALQRVIEQQAVSSDIEWRQDVDDSTLADLYRQAALLLFPSHYEGFGWPVLEAMAVGCPIVCSEALAGVAEDGAVVAPATDEAALAIACASILDDPTFALALSERARRRAAVFSRARLGNTLVEHYQAAARQALD
jgi:glycosyltransferase involved in cell wall biosynthesis